MIKELHSILVDIDNHLLRLSGSEAAVIMAKSSGPLMNDIEFIQSLGDRIQKLIEPSGDSGDNPNQRYCKRCDLVTLWSGDQCTKCSQLMDFAAKRDREKVSELEKRIARLEVKMESVERWVTPND